MLVQLLRNGTISPLPGYTSPPVIRSIQRQGQPYIEFAELYGSSDRTVTRVQLQAMMQKHQEVVEADGLTQILRQIIDQHTDYRISRLGRTFAKLPVSDAVRLLALAQEGQSEQEADGDMCRRIEAMVR